MRLFGFGSEAVQQVKPTLLQGSASSESSNIFSGKFSLSEVGGALTLRKFNIFSFSFSHQTITKVMMIAGAAGLLAGVTAASPLTIAFSICFLGGGIGKHIFRGEDKSGLRAKACRSHLQQNITFVAEWAKLGRKITPPRQMTSAKVQFRIWLKELSDEDMLDLWQTIPGKMTNIIENFPDVVAGECTIEQIVAIATCLCKVDALSSAITTLLQYVIERIEQQQEANKEFYALLSCFAVAPVIHPDLEKQLMYVKHKVANCPTYGKNAGELFALIHQKINQLVKSKAMQKDAGFHEPAVSETRRLEIRQLADQLIREPSSALFRKRKILTEMAKHESRSEIPLLVEYLGLDHIEKLWHFESQIDNRGIDPELRLTQMLQALTADQFNASVDMEAFQKIVKRFPQAALGLDSDFLKQLADSQKFDDALYPLYRLLQDDSHNQNKLASLAGLVERVNARLAKEAELKRAELPPINLFDFVDGLRATMEPIEIGETIDRINDEQLSALINLLGTGSKLDLFWKILEKKIFAQSETIKQASRLKRIYPKLSPEQVVASTQIAGFRVVLGNIEDRYIHAAVEVLSPEQIKIISKNPEMAWILVSMIQHFDPEDKSLFHKLLAIAESLPAGCDSEESEYHKALTMVRDAAGLRYVTLLEPKEGWGIFENRHHATRHLDKLFKAIPVRIQS